jgi:ABC-type phosphate transport system substrate-binding protein
MNKNLFAMLLVAGFSIVAVEASAEVVVIVNPKNASGHMSTDQVSQYFLGKSSALTPVDQPESSSIRAEFYKKVADKDPGQVKSIWSKLVFTGKGTLPRELGSDAEVKKAVAADVNGIGYIDKSAVDSSVKVIANLP